MQTLEQLKKQLDSTEELQTVVKTMKSISAVSIHQYDQAVESLLRYHRNVERGFQVLLQSMHPAAFALEPSKDEHVGFIIFGSEQGMCGSFNEDIAEYVNEHMQDEKIQKSTLHGITLGPRLSSLMRDHPHIQIDWVYDLPSSVHTISDHVNELLIRIQEWRENTALSRIRLFFNHKLSGSSYEPHHQDILPLDPQWLERLSQKEWPTRCLAQHNMPLEQLSLALIREYLFISIYRSFAESMASENASRLAAMQAAEKNIQERMEDLQSRYNRTRQDSITSELLDIISGFEALQKEERS
jgi:F-type H+-transporting ATPase subunit gamma